MKGDFSRLTFQKSNHYSSVRMQQGRPQLDADWNEQIEIQAYYNYTTTQDAIGYTGGPIHNAGFGIANLTSTTSVDVPPAFELTPGRYYVDGILCENEAQIALTTQAELPGIVNTQDASLLSDLRTNPATSSSAYLVYLDVWQRHITMLEQPELQEVALGGADTTTRTRTIWQAKLARVDDAATCSTFSDPAWIPENARSTGQLRAQSVPPAEVADELCMVPAGGGYTRLENQLYRVETHLGSKDAGGPTFKWSRDNGSMVATLENIVGSAITVSDSGKDEILGFVGPGWVELTDEEHILRSRPGYLVELASVQGNTLNVQNWPGGTALTMADFGAKPTVRRWDGTFSLASGMQSLEAGVQVELASGGIYLTGDYWLIPARSSVGDVLWKSDASGPIFEPRHKGAEHYYAPLALLRFDGTAWTATDCRKLFSPLTEMIRFFYVSGDGQEAMPGNALPRPLQVGVINGKQPVSGARVQFRVRSGNGTLSITTAGSSAAEQIVVTNSEGIAECFWNIGNSQSPQVEARLLAPDDSPVQVPIRFNANFSTASQVYYDASGCPDLNGAGVQTVQAAIDQLCRQTGGGCTVTIGPTGQYLDINAAIQELYVNQGQTDLCLCLLPGQHQLNDGLVLDNEDIHLRISGCGAATQLFVSNRPIILQKLASIVLKDLAINIPKDLERTGILCEGCSEVTIIGCHLSSLISPNLTSSAPWSVLLQIEESDRIHVENNVFRAYVAASLERPERIFAGYLQFQIFEENVFKQQASEFSVKISEDSGLREQMLRDIQERLQSLNGRNTRIYRDFIEILSAPRVGSKEILRSLENIREVEVKSLAGIAIVINDGNAETALIDNQIIGIVSLYGYSDGYGYGYNYDINVDESYTDMDENEFSRVSGDVELLNQLLKENRLRLFDSGANLQMRGNRLTRFTISEEMFRVMKDFLKDIRSGSGYGDEDGLLDLEDVYESVIFTNNLVDDTKNQWIAQHSILNANIFDTVFQNLEDVGTVIGQTAIVTNNRGFSQEQESFISVITQDAAISNNLRVSVVSS